jgi:hypothetical protein
MKETAVWPTQVCKGKATAKQTQKIQDLKYCKFLSKRLEKAKYKNPCNMDLW